MNPGMTVMHTGQNASSKLDTDQGKGIWNLLKFAAMHFHTF